MRIFIKYTTIIYLSISLCACSKALEQKQMMNSSVVDEAVLAPVFKVADVLGDNMVIQRDKPFSIWGSAPQGDVVTVKVTWNSNSFTATAKSNNSWQIIIPAAPVNIKPQKIEIKDGDKTVTIKNILIGEVWVCSGQSNMDMPVDSVGPWFGYEGVVNYQQEIADANWPGLRLIDIKDDYENNPVQNISQPAPWTVCNPANVKAYSAVAYFFGRKIMTALQVPVGLVVSSVGGTSCEAWTSKQTLLSDTLLTNNYYGKNNSSKLFNGMINPLKYMSVKGFIWYQGENNRHDNPFSNYTVLNSAMINNWRNVFAQGNLPFYLVQMTPYDENFFYGGTEKDNDYAFFREAQANILKQVSNTGMAVTLDVGDAFRIHPKDKKPVGERLGLLALNNTYGITVQSVGPQFLSYTQNNYTITIEYKAGTANGLNSKDGAALGQFFFVSGADKIFRKATAVINGDKVMLTVPASTPLPVLSVRYAFTNYPITNLQNSDGLPAEAFRTDDWPEVIQSR